MPSLLLAVHGGTGDTIITAKASAAVLPLARVVFLLVRGIMRRDTLSKMGKRFASPHWEGRGKEAPLPWLAIRLLALGVG